MTQIALITGKMDPFILKIYVFVKREHDLQENAIGKISKKRMLT